MIIKRMKYLPVLGSVPIDGSGLIERYISLLSSTIMLALFTTVFLES